MDKLDNIYRDTMYGINIVDNTNDLLEILSKINDYRKDAYMIMLANKYKMFEGNAIIFNMLETVSFIKQLPKCK